MPGPIVFDRKLLRLRRHRARALGPATFLLDRVAAELAERLSAVLRTFDIAVDLGTPTDAVRRALAESGKIGTIIAAEPDAARLDPSFPRVGADEEALPFADSSLDLVVSALALHFVNDLPGTLIQVRRALKPDGLLLAALIGGDSLIELREAFAQAESEIEGGLSPRVAPFADLRELGALMQRAGFALPVVDSDRLTVRYDTPFALMRDQHPERTPPQAAQAVDIAAHGRDLCRTLRRCRWPPARHLRDRVALRLGAAREPAEAA
jgi:SAM-dependent methyltransferase